MPFWEDRVTFRFGVPGSSAATPDSGAATTTASRTSARASAGTPAREVSRVDGARRLTRLPVHLSPGTLPRLTLLLLITAQLADLATFGLAVHTLGIADEVGPLRTVYRMGGFGAVALAKLAALGVMIAILEIYSRRTGHGRWLAILVAAMGVFGALTNILALL